MTDDGDGFRDEDRPRLSAAAIETVQRNNHAAAVAAIAVIAAEEPDLPQWVLDAIREGLMLGHAQLIALCEGRPEEFSGDFYLFTGAVIRATGWDLHEVLARIRRSASYWFRELRALPGFEEIDPESTVLLMEQHPEVMARIMELTIKGYEIEDARMRDEQRAARRLLHRLVLADGSPAEALGDAAEKAGWPLPERVVVALTAAPRSPSAEATDPPGRVLVERTADELVLLLPAGDDVREWVERTRRALGVAGPIVCGPDVPLADAHASLVHVRSAASRLHDVGPVTVFAEDRLLDLLLDANSSLATTFAQRMLSPLDGLDAVTRERMVDTLRAWLDRPNRPQAMADELYVHVQTVRYRLRQLRELFGDDLEDPDKRMNLAIAIRIERGRSR